MIQLLPLIYLILRYSNICYDGDLFSGKFQISLSYEMKMIEYLLLFFEGEIRIY